MVRLTVKYLLVLGVVFFGFQHSALADEKDKKKDDTKSSSSVVGKDTIVITRGGDITVGDTLVFDDYDEDEGKDKGENSSIATVIPPNSNAGQEDLGLAQKEDATTQVSNDQAAEPNVVIADESGMITRHEQESPASEKLFNSNLTISVYPNPAGQAFEPITLSHNLNSEVQVRIFSVTGELTKSFSSSDQRIQLTDLNSGMYIIQITGEGQSESQRLIVQ